MLLICKIKGKVDLRREYISPKSIVNQMLGCHSNECPKNELLSVSTIVSKTLFHSVLDKVKLFPPNSPALQFF